MLTQKMKRFTAVVLAGIVLGIFVSSVLAEKPRKDTNRIRSKDQQRQKIQPREQARDRLGFMTEKLNLTEEQQKKITAIFEKQAAEMKAIHDSNSAPEEKREKAMALGKKMHDEIMKVLTPEQQKKFEEMRPGGLENIKDRIAMLTKKLELTEEQQKKITSIFEKQAAEMKAIYDSNSAREEKREKAMALGKKMHDEIMKVLTPEQQEKFKEIRPQGPGGREGERPRPPQEGKGPGKDRPSRGRRHR